VRKKYIWLFIAIFLLSYSGAAGAATLTVNQTDPTCGGTGTSSTCFTSITAAINAANITSTDTIIVEPGTYVETITLKDNLPISGRDTARTFLQGSGQSGPAPLSQAAIIANGLTSVNISKFTIVSTPTSGGIQATNSTVNISNNIFLGNTAGTAIQLQGTSSGSIINNTFFQNQTAISSTVNVTITNNIFSTNGTALSAVSPLAAFTSVINNCFHINQNNGFVYNQTNDPLETNIPSQNHPAFDPMFVNTNATLGPIDLHLKEGSPCIGTGTLGNNSFNGQPSDIGAFGGASSDTIPFIIDKSKVTFTPFPPDSVTVSWPPNNCYVVTNTNASLQGGYNVSYSFNKSGSLSNPYDNKVTLASTVTSTIISGLTTSVPPPGAPVMNEPGFANETLLLSWSPVPTATSYFVHFTDLVTSATNTIPVGNFTVFELTGLINGRNYAITVSAAAQPVYHFSVTAFDNNVVSSGGGTPGKDNESAFFNPDLSVLVGTPSEGPLSTPVIAFPEAIIPTPDLPNKGCFIATAAYGYYSAPQVQALRAFRDQYLMASSPGRAFVEWYYRYGPIGAEFINAHTWLKPVVRTALMPAVGGALFMTRTSSLTKVAVLILAGILAGYLIQRRKHAHSGGER
jgi:hypothetical protein